MQISHFYLYPRRLITAPVEARPWSQFTMSARGIMLIDSLKVCGSMNYHAKTVNKNLLPCIFFSLMLLLLLMQLTVNYPMSACTQWDDKFPTPEWREKNPSAYPARQNSFFGRLALEAQWTEKSIEANLCILRRPTSSSEMLCDGSLNLINNTMSLSNFSNSPNSLARGGSNSFAFITLADHNSLPQSGYRWVTNESDSFS